MPCLEELTCTALGCYKCVFLCWLRARNKPVSVPNSSLGVALWWAIFNSLSKTKTLTFLIRHTLSALSCFKRTFWSSRCCYCTVYRTLVYMYHFSLAVLLFFQWWCVWGIPLWVWHPPCCCAFFWSVLLLCIPLLPSPAWQPCTRASPATGSVRLVRLHGVFKRSVFSPWLRAPLGWTATGYCLPPAQRSEGWWSRWWE